MNALMAVMAVIASAAAIWGSVLGCKVTCCAAPVTGVCISVVDVVLFLFTVAWYLVYDITTIRHGGISDLVIHIWLNYYYLARFGSCQTTCVMLDRVVFCQLCSEQ